MILAEPGQEELVCFFLQTWSQTSPMSVWLPARPEGTKDHRELSAQRGTDMSFSPSIPTLQSPIRNTLSAPQCQRARRPQPNPSHQAGLCRCSCWRDKYCRVVIGRGAPIPECTPASSSGAEADADSINQAHLPDMGRGAESMN